MATGASLRRDLRATAALVCLVVPALLFAGAAQAKEVPAEAEGPEAAAHAGPSVPDVVFHHVADSREIELENPWTGDQLIFKLPHWAVPIPEGVPLVGGKVFDLSPSKHLIFMWIAAGLLVLVLSLASRKRALVPSGLYSVMEVFVNFVREELAVKNIGKAHADHYVGFLCTAFFFILAVNLLGLVPFTATATGNLNVTAALALCSLVMTLLAGMRAQGVVGYWLHIVPAGVPLWLYPVMIPVELLGIVAKPVALALRLFANMVAGHIVVYFLLGLIFLLHGLLGDAGSYGVSVVSVLFATAIYMLEIFVAFLQAYIFTMLSALFIGLASHAH